VLTQAVDRFNNLQESRIKSSGVAEPSNHIREDNLTVRICEQERSGGAIMTKSAETTKTLQACGFSKDSAKT
jgi:hypothetical protein